MQQDNIRIKTSQFPNIAARIYGSGPDVLVLIHGFPATGNLWRGIPAFLPDNFKLIVPDLPGVGDSLPGNETVRVEDLAGGIVEMLDQLGIQQAVFAGHSMGGYVSLAIAEKWPEKVTGLSLVHSTAKADDEEKIVTRRKAIALIEKGGKEPFIRANVVSLFSPVFKEAHDAVVQQQIAEGLSVPEQTLIAFYNAMINRPDRTGVLQKATFPVQWIIGEDDKVIPKEKSLQQSSLSSVSFVSVYNNCGHMSMLEQVEALAGDLEAFANYCKYGKMEE